MVSEAFDPGVARGDPDKSRDPRPPWVDIRGLSKHFAGEVALRDVDMGIVRGEVHGLVGANGAGKSTLIRCLAGVTVPDEGAILVDGEELRLGSPQASEKRSVAADCVTRWSPCQARSALGSTALSWVLSDHSRRTKLPALV